MPENRIGVEFMKRTRYEHLPPSDQQEHADPLTQWLLEQLDDARREANKAGNLKVYRLNTLEWIDSVRDFLRY